MISSFILKNMVTSDQVVFGQDFDCDYLYLSGDLDWGNVPATHNTYNYPNQIGSSFSSTKVNERDITVTGYVFYTPTPAERALYGDQTLEFAYGKVKELKRRLNELINPLNEVQLIVDDYYVEGKPAATPQYGVNEADNNLYFCKFTFTVFCANPMFRLLTGTKTVMNGEYGIFHFPFIIKPTKYVMSKRVNYQIIVVANEGNIEVGGKITLIAKGDVVNPRVENIATGEYFKINKTLHDGEKVVINTNEGEEKSITGYYQGVTTTYLQYWDFNGSWIKFGIGATTIGYSTENESEMDLEVYIDINPAKYGLEEM